MKKGAGFVPILIINNRNLKNMNQIKEVLTNVADGLVEMGVGVAELVYVIVCVCAMSLAALGLLGILASPLLLALQFNNADWLGLFLIHILVIAYFVGRS